ncbi:acyl-CoA dehydrogenase family protein [Rhodoferax sp.]|uniref:acyl-CoA dehydrogenase family protein n=1 Tax=Rhodoferax sp. TaxID=50421 RepID=UPI002728B387|nr:acyl-CoA dehydrogenase family protein [Rhodoferax sp.]MDO9195414.1 acyl-CoA dehydrogenase family protein [Rhodoferax sp.]
MNLATTVEEEVFRQDVRAFIREHMPADLAEQSRRQFHLAPAQALRWQKILHRQGWEVPAWPVEHGGTGWTAVQRYIFEEECALADAPFAMLAGVGIPMVGPVIYTFGNAKQKAEYLPRIRSGEDFWCQGFSEPGAGSDLASLRTRAVRDGDDYIINGQKIWTSMAQHANMIFCLVRTDPEAKTQQGISFLVFSLDRPGITIRPIISIDGAHSLNEVFFENVRVPASSLLGEEGKGWTYAKFLLGHERFSLAEVARSKRRLERLRAFALEVREGQRPLADDVAFRRRAADIEIDLLILEQLARRVAWEMDMGIENPGGASILKLRGTQTIKDVNELWMDALGHWGLAFEDMGDGTHGSPTVPELSQGRAEEFLYLQASTIYGGTSETQRNIVAKLIYAGQ